MEDRTPSVAVKSIQLSRRGFFKNMLCAGASFGFNSVGQATTHGGRVRWQGHDVAKVPDGYQVAVSDVDGDGRLDILALSSQENIVAWYQNPLWKARSITSDTRKNISLAPLFRAGYPARGLALASDFYLDQSERGGSVWWAEPGALPDAEWPTTLIGRIPTSHRLRWADLDGDGRLELVDIPLLGAGAKPPDYSVPSPMTWFEMPEAFLMGHAENLKQPPNSWITHLIDRSLTVVHGILVMDWNKDGRDELLTASFEGVNLFESQGRGAELRWEKTLLVPDYHRSSSRRGASEIGVGSVHGRRFLATIEPWHGEQVVVYTQTESSRANGAWQRHVIDTSFQNGHALVCADLNGDGNDEIVAGYRGPGTSLYVYYAADPYGVVWERQTLDTDMATSGVVIADIDGNGRPDIVAIGSTTANVKWYENLGART